MPICEDNPLEAVKTNIIGADNAINAGIRNNVKKVLCLSTDKAVNPVSAMGISKALMERVVLSRTKNLVEGITKLVIARFGNIIASRGSLVPLIIEQIKTGQEITITDPEMTRFLMTEDEMVDLAIKSFEEGKQGDIFVYKSRAAKLKNIARALIELFEANNQTRIIGLREGEKMHESLLTEYESCKADVHNDFYVIRNKTCKKNLKRPYDFSDFSSNSVEQLSIEQIKYLLLTVLEVKMELQKRAQVK